MAKRIVSGIFILTALGALGVLLAGAMTSGEQLIVRFLTAVTVAALALYVISDLRLQNEQEEPPVERNRPAGEQSTTQAAAATATVTASRRRKRLTGRDRHAPTPTVPNFEAIEPVTARSRTPAVADPTEAVTGSRLVAPATDQIDRIVPPHPMAGHRVQQPIGHHGSPATPPIEPHPPVRPNPPMPPGESADDSFAGLVDLVAEPVTGPVDATPEFLTTPGEPAPESSTGSVIANTAFTYSGRLHAMGVDWPPRPPDREEGDAPGPTVTANGDAANGDATNGDAVDVSAVDAPTSELPALAGVPARDADDDPFAGLFPSEVVTEDSLDGTSAPPRPTSHLFAVDTAELLLIEPADSAGHGEKVDVVEAFRFGDAQDLADAAGGVWSEVGTTDPDDHGFRADPADDMGSTWPMAGDPPIPTTTSFRQIEAAQYATPLRTDHLDLRDPDHLVTTDEVARPVRAASTHVSPPADKLTAAIRSGEIQVINSLISQGMLSTSGPITDRDVRTMVYVAFTSNELRKLILAGGTPDGIRAGDLDLGDVELFDESRFAPPPKRLYAGPPAQPAKAPDPVLDLVALEGASTPGVEAEHDLDAELVPTMPTPRHLYRRVDADRVDQ